jgi:hypothetical protein
MQAAPLAQAVGRPINFGAVIEELLKAFDHFDVERFFSAQPQGALADGGVPGMTSPGGAPEGDPLGVTAPSASDATSPSNALSLSPMRMLQRAGAMRGGGRNV